MRLFAIIACLLVFLPAPGFAAQADGSLGQLVQELQKNPKDDALREKIIRQAQAEKPAIPEEARRHFVKGATIAKEARNADGQKLAVKSFEEALKIAPWWGDAWYNLAVAQELAGQYADARASLKFFIQTGPGEKEAREAQDRMYALEAKQDLKKDEAASAQKATEEKALKAAQKKAEQQAVAREKESQRWNARWKMTSQNSQYGTWGSPMDLQSDQKSNVIEFINPTLAEMTRVSLRGTVSGSGSITWELNRWPCGNKPVSVTVSPDHNTLQYSVNTIDSSNCGYFSDINTVTITRQ